MTTTQKPADMAFAVHPRPSQRPFAAKSPSSCIDCKPASDCAEPSCSATSTLTPQCTDQCVVIACDDPDHPAATCGGQGKDAGCNFVCDNTMNCEDCHSLDVFLQCCNDAHPFAAHQRPVPTFPQTGDWNWPSSMDEAWCHSCVTPDAKLAGQQPSAAPSMVSVRETNQFLEALSMNSTPSSQGTSHHPVSPHLSAPQQFDPSASLNFGCEWGNCQSSFNSLPHLIDHLNYDHLQINAQAGPSLHEQQQHQQYPHTLDLLPSSEISCQWHHCREPAYHMATPAALYNHLMNEHLKSLANTLSSMDSDQTLTNPYPTSPVESPTSIRRQPSQEQIRLPEPVAEDHKLKLVSSESPTNSRHPCRWKDCNLEFDSYDSLTTHINSNHIGGGKAHYECFWEGCSRNGQQGFQSKQKICRHVQSHTGHRPFQCTICHQNFSEAATLQQHIRRHTQEKPYVCDFPGCGKSFAITGALTIHKRTHNGDKPFKCSYCDRGFAESSNLSKHLRTHTGARPYMCPEPNCGKAFARPDQLTRHKGVHRKQLNAVNQNTVVDL